MSSIEDKTSLIITHSTKGDILYKTEGNIKFDNEDSYQIAETSMPFFSNNLDFNAVIKALFTTQKTSGEE